jgi:hypothetical protein
MNRVVLAIAAAAVGCGQRASNDGARRSAADEAAPSALITPGPIVLEGIRIVTQHNDNQRTGANLKETLLNPSNVRPSTFGHLFSLPVDEQIFAQPLYLGATSIQDATTNASVIANVVYAATMNNTVYAFDADRPREPYWTTHLVEADGGWRPNILGSGHVPEPHTGILSTPVIDPQAGVMYVVTRERLTATPPPACPVNGSTARYLLHRLDVRTGAVQASTVVDGAARQTPSFDPNCVLNRPGLLLSNGRIYIAFGSMHENPTMMFHGWVIAYDAGFRAGEGALDSLCTTPRRAGGGVWQSGNGLATDASGESVFFMTGNSGIIGGFPSLSSPDGLEESLVKVALAPAGQRPVFGARQVRPSNDFYDVEQADMDLGSGGPLVLPGDRLVGGGKPGVFYVMSTTGAFVDAQPSFQAFSNVYEPNVAPRSKIQHVHGSPVLWNLPGTRKSYIYAWSENDRLRRFTYDNATRTVSVPQWPSSLGREGTEVPARRTMPGGFLSISANGADRSSGIVWAVINEGDALYGPTTGFLEAYEAHLLGAPIFKDRIPMYAKYTPPTIANGKVYVATLGFQLRVYGLRTLSSQAGIVAPIEGTPATPFCASGEVSTGDFNGDSHADLLCREPGGGIAIAFANASGGYDGESWRSPTAWCPNRWTFVGGGLRIIVRKLLVGDFDADGHDDAVCHDPVSGADSFAFAPLDGKLDVAHAWNPARTWCSSYGEQLLVGDFNGDGRADLVCHNTITGGKIIRYADPRGTFDTQTLPPVPIHGTKADWVKPAFGWCYGAGDELYAGDFNGDHKSDLLCHNPTSAEKWMILANDAGELPTVSSGDFGVTTYHDTLNRGWCVSSPQGRGALGIANFDGDGKDDMFCHGVEGGGEWVDFTGNPPSLYVPVGTSSITTARPFCAHVPGTAAPRVLVADVDGDRRADVICHDRGGIRVAYSPLLGR